MFDPFKNLRKHWYIRSDSDLGGVYVAIAENRETHAIRIAYKRYEEDRVHLTPEIGQTSAKNILNRASEGFQRGNAITILQHEDRLLRTQLMPARWESHRKRMLLRKEEKQMNSNPAFGMF